MADLSPQAIAAKLLQDDFARKGPTSETPTDPIADTPMVVTLDALRPYELNPRITRNPLYEEIKSSIRERGLDAPPAITRRPGDTHYVIRNGGNTRLAVLRELWAETKDERFFRIACLFRPWPERGEIIALTGHLAESELHGGLTFIERALGVERARELYEQEGGKTLSQSELARRLTTDGYPITQPHISRMQEAVRYLLPAIPNLLYAGLGRPQVEKLTTLRKAGQRVWEKRVGSQQLTTDFPTLFQDTLAMFDHTGEHFSIQRLQDELVGQLAEQLDTDYDTLALELDEGENWQRALNREPRTVSVPLSPEAPCPPPLHDSSAGNSSPATIPRHEHTVTTAPAATLTPSGTPANDGHLQSHIVSPAASTERLQSIQRLVAEHTGDAISDFASNVLQSVPVQAGGLYPISDIWFIDSALDVPSPLRVHIAQLALEIAEEAELADRIEVREDGIGFRCEGEPPRTPFPCAVFALLSTLSQVDRQGDREATPTILPASLPNDLAQLLVGTHHPHRATATRLSDVSLVKLFRLIRLARHLGDLEAPEDMGAVSS